MTDAAYSLRLVSAMEQAARWHRTQWRKGTAIPYLAHPLRVCALVLDDGGSEDEACAALLHDAVEDTEATLADIERLCGAEVARIVELCSDDHGAGIPAGEGGAVRQGKAAWKRRKELHFEHLISSGRFDTKAARVMAADKVANLTSQLDNAAAQGPASWDRFKGGIAGTLWYLETATALVVAQLPDSVLVGDLCDGLDRFRSVRDDAQAKLAGLDHTVTAALAAVMPAPTLEAWSPATVELVGFEIARGIEQCGRDPRTSATTVLTNWFAPKLDDPQEQAGVVAEFVAGPFAPLIAAVEHALG